MILGFGELTLLRSIRGVNSLSLSDDTSLLYSSMLGMTDKFDYIIPPLIFFELLPSNFLGFLIVL